VNVDLRDRVNERHDVLIWVNNQFEIIFCRAIDGKKNKNKKAKTKKSKSQTKGIDEATDQTINPINQSMIDSKVF
jgi:hypothetical protein